MFTFGCVKAACLNVCLLAHILNSAPRTEAVTPPPLFPLLQYLPHSSNSLAAVDVNILTFIFHAHTQKFDDECMQSSTILRLI